MDPAQVPPGTRQAKPATPLARRIIPPKPLLSAVVVASFVGLLYLVEGIDTLMNNSLDDDGVIPRDFSEWDNLIWYPMLHHGWAHLTSNAVPLLVLGFLASSGGVKQFLQVTAVIWLTSALGIWLVGTPASHIGASGLVFGYLLFLLVRGIFAGSYLQILVAALVFGVYGYALWGVLPGQEGVSWEAHLFGAIGGVLAAWGVARDARRAPSPPASLVA